MTGARPYPTLRPTSLRVVGEDGLAKRVPSGRRPPPWLGRVEVVRAIPAPHLGRGCLAAAVCDVPKEWEDPPGLWVVAAFGERWRPEWRIGWWAASGAAP